jgi:hypothetical protein
MDKTIDRAPTENGRELTRYKEGDEKEIVSLFNSVFNLNRPLDQWVWKFKENPYGGPFVSIMRATADSKILGYHTVMPFPLNAMGKPLLACQTLDIVVRAENRMQGIFEKTGLDCTRQCEEAGVEAIMGSPNQSSYPGFIRSLGWSRILFLKHYLLRLEITDKLQRFVKLRPLAKLLGLLYRVPTRLTLSYHRFFLKLRVDRNLTFFSSPTVPPDYDSLWNACRPFEVLSIWKDSRYFKWRYDQNPAHEFTYHYLKKEGEIVALAVAVEREGAITLCEILVKNRETILGRFLVNKICLHYFNKKSTSVDFLGHDMGFFDDLFQSFKRRISYENVYC